MMLIVLVFSSFVSDTAVTAIMIPVVLAYCQKARLPVKQFLSILGYAALTGGTNTVIGTSTNLVISGEVRYCLLAFGNSRQYTLTGMWLHISELAAAFCFPAFWLARVGCHW